MLVNNEWQWTLVFTKTERMLVELLPWKNEHESLQSQTFISTPSPSKSLISNAVCIEETVR
jgi:hypothetical protein